ncbi:MAG: hypothetical protein K5682_08320 [Lachnospiraceae bacterium]|nr:hypothetical protein [Lachnospiraceae bacterium]
MIIFKRLLLLNKRLFYRKSYILLLIMCPLIVLTLRNAASYDDNIIQVALYDNGIRDAVTEELFENFRLEHEEMIFVDCTDEETAVQSVTDGTVDVAWIVQRPLSEIQQEIEEGSFGSRKDAEPFLKVCYREKNVEDTFVSELLNCAIYRYTSYAAYVSEARGHAAGEWSDEALLQVYEDNMYDKTFLKSYYLDGTDADTEDASMFVMPMRGMLALWLFLLGLVAALYYGEDEKKGLFICWKDRDLLIEMAYIFTILVNGSIVYLLSIWMAGIFTTLRKELICLSPYVLCTVCFAMILRRVSKNDIIYSMMMPLIILANIMFCPIFIQARVLWVIKIVFPLYHYLNSIHDPYFVNRMFVYFIACVCILTVRSAIKFFLPRRSKPNKLSAIS